jgi:hypothetical protein
MLKVSRSVLALIVWAVPTVAASDPITIDLFRFAVASARVDTHVDLQAGSNRDLMTLTSITGSGVNAASAAADLASVLSTDARNFSGSGSTQATAESADRSVNIVDGSAATTITWSFHIDEPQLFDFTGTFTASPEQPADFGFEGVASWFTFLRGPISRSNVFRHSGRASAAITERRRLLPGRYDFRLHSDSTARVAPQPGVRAANSAFRFSVDLIPAAEPVPEPGSLALLSSGFLAALGAIRRRERASATGAHKPTPSRCWKSKCY